MTVPARQRIVDAALSLLCARGGVSLDTVAAQAGLTKPGLMHHFRTKEALMLGLVDHVVDGWVLALGDRIAGPADRATATGRMRAYLDWSLAGDFDMADLVMLADPKLRGTLTARWAERLAPWVTLPDDLPADVRGRLTAVRLIADGAWLADATGVFPLDPTGREQVRAVAESLLGECP